MAGWTVDLLDSGGNLLQSTTTDASGNYSFASVAPGSYGLAQVVNPNWVRPIRASR